MKSFWLAVLLFFSASCAFAQFSGSGTYSTADGSAAVGITYLGGETWRISTPSADGTLLTADIPDSELGEWLTGNLGGDYVFAGNDTTTASENTGTDLTYITPGYSGTHVGYAMFRVGPFIYFAGQIGDVRIGDFNPNNAQRNFEDFTEIVGDYLSNRGDVHHDSLYGLENMFNYFTEMVWDAFTETVSDILDGVFDAISNLFG
jgi:hypothetical protein